MKNYPEILQDFQSGIREWRTSAPEAHQAFSQVIKVASAAGVLDAKTKELIALALGVAARCDGCIAHHAQNLVRLGATREEVAETLAVAVEMGGGPSLMYSGNAMTAFLQMQEAAQKA